MFHQDNPSHDSASNNKSCNEKEKRVKPVVPAKPTFIPPPANSRQSVLVQATAPQRSTTFRSINNIENQHNSPHSRTKCSKTTSSHIVPSSPNLACSNECCGIPLPGTSSKQQTNHNHNNNNNNVKETCNQSQRPGDQRSSNDSLDCSSSISSNSGGFKDPEFIARQNDFERNLENSKLKMVIGDNDSRFNSATASTEKSLHESQSTTAKKVESTNQSQQEQLSNRSSKTGTNTFFQQSTKQLEQMLAQRIEKENRCVQQQQQHQINKKKRTTSAMGTSRPETTTGNCVPDQASSSLCKQEPNISALQKQFQHRLHDEMKLHCKSIQEKHLIEKRFPQEHYKPAVDEDVSSNRSQPAIGLKQTPKARPTIFGTVADRCPKDGLNRRGFPQTTQSNSNVATEFCHPESDEHEKGSDLDDNALVYRDGNLISGSLDALLQHMVPTSDYYPDKSYLFAFLLSARLFIRPHELLTKISQLCDIQQSLTPSTQSQCTTNTQELSRFAKHFVQLLAEWIETFPYDFRDDRLMQQVRSMTQKCINVDGNLRKEVSAMLQNLLHRLNVLDQYEEHLGRMNVGTDRDDLTSSSSSSSSHLPATSNSNSFNTSIHSTSLSIGPTSGTSSGDITELCPSPTLLSHQLTHIELERLSHIGPEEFVQAFAKENPHLETSFNDMKKTRNLESYVQWFNRLSYLVATEIVKHPKKKQRIRVVEYWIETGRECFNIGNFNSLMAIIAGLNMSPISRLKKTWAKVQTAKFSVLEHQMDPTSNFNSYRSTLKAAMWRSAGATDERQRIVIPFFSLLVKDLYFLNEGCSNKLPNGHINFDKFWQLAKQVTEFIAWKQVTCTFEKLPKVILFLQTNHVLNENTLAMASFECEPPDNQHEKDRYKLLKSEQNQH
ncbi:ras-GEF domain-containing family member 1B-A-like isoform X1 [Bradysia coprophila]|uniref:ras-GEF domain-containing family member 1B-A-like isoform X1 n=1 Tax=Bradysia coprophila TaxID=38358 RepID=UPI00187DB3C3|nr:ras-GEF domain-containing family member 1B-A-like isoform X1 [Bradysia coprophila]